MIDSLPVGKLPVELLARLIGFAPLKDERVLVGPGIGMDCAVLDFGERLLVLKSDPITFATAEIGWYVVQVNANDVATTGAKPRWMMITLLLPEKGTTPELVEGIVEQIHRACQQIQVSVVGGHTEITHGLDRPLLIGALLGEVDRSRLITPKGARPGDRILLTKGVPIEATAICAREFADHLKDSLSPEEIKTAQNFLYRPGISVLRDAQLAVESGKITAMHDPTEGGLSGALWELAEACGHCLVINTRLVHVPELSQRICRILGLDPLASIASGALLLTASPDTSKAVIQTLIQAGIACAEIGYVESGPPFVWQSKGTSRQALSRPERDEITRLFE
jgi:hydrogenase expression/formation protein HypE